MELKNPFGDSFPDPLCKLNLKETSEFVSGGSSSSERRRSSVVQRRPQAQEAPSTPGRPVFNFRKSIPSKWDDAEKWLISSSCHESPAHVSKGSESLKLCRQNSGGPQKSSYLGGFHGVPHVVFLKDKFTDNVEPFFPNFQYSEPTKESFLFAKSFCDPSKDSTTTTSNSSTVTAESSPQVQHRDIGTEMTPLGSSTNSRAHTPIKKFPSPPRHNTPADRSGPLVGPNSCFDISEIKECHFAELDLGAQFDSVASKWSSREEEEEEISKSLRHFDTEGGRKSNEESRASVWEAEERTKSCIRYQREEARIQAWVNLQKAKAEAESRKLEVKIQKMRSDMEEKLMKRMAIVNRRAEEWRASAQLQHSQQILKASEQAQKMKCSHRKSQPRSQFTDCKSCGCIPCNKHF